MCEYVCICICMRVCTYVLESVSMYVCEYLCVGVSENIYVCKLCMCWSR